MQITLLSIALLCSLTTLATCCVDNRMGTVRCSDSALSSIPTNIYNTAVKSLDFSNNDLGELDRNSLISYPDLNDLYLDQNKITVIEKRAFSELKSLQHLDLSNNQIASLKSDIFSSNAQLKTLSLRNNQLHKWLAHHGEFLLSESLTSLDLSRNTVTSIHSETFRGLPSLVNIDLRSNSLTALPIELFHGLDNLRTVLLAKNPWNCSREFQVFLERYPRQIKDFKSLTCKEENGTTHFEAEMSVVSIGGSATGDASFSTQVTVDKVSSPPTNLSENRTSPDVASISEGPSSTSTSSSSQGTVTSTVSSAESSKFSTTSSSKVPERSTLSHPRSPRIPTESTKTLVKQGENKIGEAKFIPVVEQDDDYALYMSLMVTLMLMVIMLGGVIAVGFIFVKKEAWCPRTTKQNGKYAPVLRESV